MRSRTHQPLLHPGSDACEAMSGGGGVCCANLGSSGVNEEFATDLVLARDIHGMTTIETDAELLRRSASEPVAFGELYKRHGVALRRYVVSRVGIGNGEDLAA